MPPSTPGTKLAQAAEPEEEEEPAAEPAAKPAPRFAKFDRNNFKCTRCLKVALFLFVLLKPNIRLELCQHAINQ